MEAWQIVLLVVVIVVVLALIAWAASRRRVSAKRAEQARAHLNEARERQARAESTRAAADEKAAQLRRERAELEQRAAQAERESAQLAADADRDETRAAELQERARKLDPQLADETRHAGAETPAVGGYGEGSISNGHAGRDMDDPALRGTTADRFDEPTVVQRDTTGPGATTGSGSTAEQDRPPATAYRHTAPVTDPEGATAGTADVTDRLDRDRLDADRDGVPDRHETVVDRQTVVDRDAEDAVDRQTVVDRDAEGTTVRETRETVVDADGDGVPDAREHGGGGLRRIKDRLTGRVDDRDPAVEDQDVSDATRRRP
jgi:Tfp pilus assembly protein PilE